MLAFSRCHKEVASGLPSLRDICCLRCFIFLVRCLCGRDSGFIHFTIFPRVHSSGVCVFLVLSCVCCGVVSVLLGVLGIEFQDVFMFVCYEVFEDVCWSTSRCLLTCFSSGACLCLLQQVLWVCV